MAKIEKVIMTSDFEQGTIYVNDGNYGDSTTGIRSINIIPIGIFKKFTIDVSDTSGNPLTFSFVGYNSSGTFINSRDISLGWKESSTVIDISSYSTIVGIRVIINADHDITPLDLGSCKITLTGETAWVIENGYPYLDTIGEQIEVTSEPYPYSVMIQKEGEYPKYPYLDIIDVGAFANATKLKYVRIPESVKKIGEYAFRNTLLTSVTIARDCEYYPTSFPDGCVVNFY